MLSLDRVEEVKTREEVSERFEAPCRDTCRDNSQEHLLMHGLYRRAMEGAVVRFEAKVGEPVMEMQTVDLQNLLLRANTCNDHRKSIFHP